MNMNLQPTPFSKRPSIRAIAERQTYVHMYIYIYIHIYIYIYIIFSPDNLLELFAPWRCPFQKCVDSVHV